MYNTFGGGEDVVYVEIDGRCVECNCGVYVVTPSFECSSGVGVGVPGTRQDKL